MRLIAAIKNKVLVTALLSVILGVVLLNNLKEQNNDAKINEAIAAIHDDRLVVEGYIFNYSQHLQHIIELSDDMQTQKGQITEELSEIGKMNGLYAQTQLTKEEEDSFGEFIYLCEKIEQGVNENNADKTLYYTKKAKSVLPVLSDIQIQEASVQMLSLKRLFGSNTISSQFEIGILVIIALLIMALQFTGKIVKANHFPKSPSMN